MVLIVCVDDRYGMSFHNRRQSRDRSLYERIASIVGDKSIVMRQESAKLFPGDNGNVCISDDLHSTATESDYCFVETDDPTPLLACADAVILYRWNRSYPADLYFPIDILRDSWTFVSAEDFPGNSHERITQEVYHR